MRVPRTPADLVLLANPVSGQDAQRAARQELQRPEYHRDDPSLVQQVLSWLSDQLDRMSAASLGQSALIVLGVLLAVVVGFLLVRAGAPTRRARSSAADPLAAADGLEPSDGNHARAAQHSFEAGDYAEALRLWLRAVQQDLQRRGVLDVRPGRTAEDIARIGGSQLPDAAAALTAATEAFDAIWFGGRTATAADAIAGRAAAAAVRTGRVRSGPVEFSGYAVPR